MSVYRDGRWRSLEAVERRKARDRARIRARLAVMRAHREEFLQIDADDPDTDRRRRYQRSLRRLAGYFPAEYAAALEVELHPCSAVSTTGTVSGAVPLAEGEGDRMSASASERCG